MCKKKVSNFPSPFESPECVSPYLSPCWCGCRYTNYSCFCPFVSTVRPDWIAVMHLPVLYWDLLGGNGEPHSFPVLYAVLCSGWPGVKSRDRHSRESFMQRLKLRKGLGSD